MARIKQGPFLGCWWRPIKNRIRAAISKGDCALLRQLLDGDDVRRVSRLQLGHHLAQMCCFAVDIGKLETIKVILSHHVMDEDGREEFFKAAVSSKWVGIVQDLLDDGYRLPRGVLSCMQDLEMLDMLIAAVPESADAVEYLAGDGLCDSNIPVAKVLLQKYMQLRKYEATE